MTFLHTRIQSLSWMGMLRVGTALLSGSMLLSLGKEYAFFYGKMPLIDSDLLQLGKATPITLIQIDTFVYFVYILCCLFLLLGFVTKVSTGILLLLHAGIFTSLPEYSYGADYFINILLFYCLIFPTQKVDSLDNYFFKHQTPAKLTIQRCLSILRIHLALVYFFSGADKALGGDWWNGEALWKALHLPYLTSSIFTTQIDQLPILFFQSTGVLVLLLELTYPINLFLKRTRSIYLYFILSMHLGIALFMNLWLFSSIMIFFNAICWFSQGRDASNMPSFFLYKSNPASSTSPCKQEQPS